MKKKAVVEHCGVCSRDIESGEQYQCIEHHIETAEINRESMRLEIQVLDAELTMVICSGCSKRLPAPKLRVKLAKALQEMLAANEKPAAKSTTRTPTRKKP